MILDNSCSCTEAFVYIKGSYQLYKLGINLSTDQSNHGSSWVLFLICLYAGPTYSIVLTIVHICWGVKNICTISMEILLIYILKDWKEDLSSYGKRHASMKTL